MAERRYVLTGLDGGLVAYGYTDDDPTPRRLAYVDDSGRWIMHVRGVERVPIAPPLLEQVENVLAGRDAQGRELPRG